MNKFSFFLMVILAISLVGLSSCQQRESSYAVQWSPDQKDSVVYVQHYDQSSNRYDDFYMNYFLYRSLFQSGGYSNVYNYYQQHPTEFQNEYRYSSYSSSNSPLRNSSVSNNNSYSSPSRSTGLSSSSSSSSRSSYSSPSRSSSSNSSRSSYSSPSRSNYSSSSSSRTDRRR